LVRLIEDLSPHNAPANRRKPIPARHRAWQPLHEISIDVLGGLGLNYKQGQAHAPGYLVDTWRVWEDLLTVAARLGFGRNAVLPQRGYPLGTKTKISTGVVSKLSVYPDCVIEPDGTRPKMLLDAKYKGHVEKGQPRISEADIYEALAFSKSTECNLVALAYPAQPGDAPQPVGTCTVFESIQVDAVQIIGLQVECRGVSKAGGLRLFSSNFGAGVRSCFP
jgi:5-methylcytosine-specific restriction endonuclease McrBC regulatory subunit McrC